MEMAGDGKYDGKGIYANTNKHAKEGEWVSTAWSR